MQVSHLDFQASSCILIEATHWPRSTKYSLNEIREMVKDNEDMQNLNHVDQWEYIHKLNEHRALQHMSIHATNTAAARDVQSTLDTIFKMVGLISRDNGHLTNKCIAWWSCCPNRNLRMSLCLTWTCVRHCTGNMVWNWQCHGLLGGCCPNGGRQNRTKIRTMGMHNWSKWVSSHIYIYLLTFTCQASTNTRLCKTCNMFALDSSIQV